MTDGAALSPAAWATAEQIAVSDTTGFCPKGAVLAKAMSLALETTELAAAPFLRRGCAKQSANQKSGAGGGRKNCFRQLHFRKKHGTPLGGSKPAAVSSRGGQELKVA